MNTELQVNSLNKDFYHFTEFYSALANKPGGESAWEQA
jgi:hypothetical protein